MEEYRFPIFKMISGRLIAYYDYIPGRSRKPDKETRNKNLEACKPSGVFTTGAAKRLKDIVNDWISCIDAEMIVNGDGKSDYQKYITFCTLTLSASQFHTDYEIRRNMLMPFLQSLKRKHQVRNYIHVSEAQVNGNIHFHILLDRPISWKSILKIWNTVQENNGYVQKFCDKWGHRHPNSTDIHQLENVTYIAKYIVKYFTKTEDRRMIQGRIWGCSDELKDIEPLRGEFTTDLCEELFDLAEQNRGRMYESEYFSVLNYGNIRDLEIKFPKLFELFVLHFSSEFEKLYGNSLQNYNYGIL